MIAEAALIREIKRHNREGMDVERSTRALFHRIAAETIAELGTFGPELHTLAAKAAETGLRADADRFLAARLRLAPADWESLAVALERDLYPFRRLTRRIAAGKVRV